MSMTWHPGTVFESLENRIQIIIQSNLFVLLQRF